MVVVKFVMRYKVIHCPNKTMYRDDWWICDYLFRSQRYGTEQYPLSNSDKSGLNLANFNKTH